MFSVAKSFPKPQKPIEVRTKDLWCDTCCRGLQDKHAMRAHIRGRKHLRAEAESLEQQETASDGGVIIIDDSEESDDDRCNDQDNDHNTFYTETPTVNADRVAELLSSGIHREAPPSFRMWANKSLSAARNKGQQAIIDAVFREVSEELAAHSLRGTLCLQDWCRRDVATGDRYACDQAKLVEIPLAPKKQSTLPVKRRHVAPTQTVIEIIDEEVKG